jgi:ADP-ribose pyrophosphatase YjhB (NUDIX family)
MTIGVRVLMVREDKILLVKHVYEDKWFLPGGIVERGETLDEAVCREAMEEVGAILRDLHLFGTYTNIRDRKNDHIAVFISKDFTLNGKSDHEIEAVSFYALDGLPDNVSTGSKNRINDFVRGEKTRYGHW